MKFKHKNLEQINHELASILKINKKYQNYCFIFKIRDRNKIFF